MKRLYLIFAICLASIHPAAAQLVINEIMQSNIDCIMDDLNEFPDSWVELYNGSNAAIDLSAYRLGTSRLPEEAYQLPHLNLPAKGHRLIYCDNSSTSNPWHTRFRLESGKGCSVYLFLGTEIVDSIAGLKKQPAPNIAYGRISDGNPSFGYLSKPTPGKANSGEICSHSQILQNPVFSHEGRVFESASSLLLTVTMPEGSPAGAELHYTTDGSEPTALSSLFPIGGLKISATCILRVKPFCKGYLSPRSTAQSYIFLNRKMTLPVVSIITDKRYLTDSKIGIYVDGSYQSGKKNYEFDWRRPINLELFESAASASVLNQLCETRIQGGATRNQKLKSLALYAHKRFGEKKFDYELFPDDRPEQTNFKSLLLRNAGNDFDYLYMRDAIIQRTLASYVDVDWQAWRPAIVYINGVYKGIENFRERSNDHNIYTNYDGLEDVTMVENWKELKTGNSSRYKDLTDFMNSDSRSREEYEARVDVSEFLDVMVAQVYFNNLDAPGNNFCIWRPNADDGRWRVLLKDMDYTMGLYGDAYNYKYLHWLYNPKYDANHNWGANSEEGTRLFRNLMEIPECKELFINRCLVYMGDFLNHDAIWELWEPMYNLIKSEYPNHRALNNQWWSNYSNELSNARTWLKNRTTYLYTYLCSYYSLGTPRQLQVNTNLSASELDRIRVSINDIPLSRGTFNGRMPMYREIRLEGENVEKWEVTTSGSYGKTSQTLEGSSVTFTMPNCQLATITAVPGNGLGIDEMDDTETDGDEMLYDANGRPLSHLQEGLNIVVKRKGGKVVREKILQ